MNKKIALVAGVSVLALTGCAIETTTSTSVEPPDPAIEALEALKGDLKLTGTATWTREYPNPYYSLNNNTYINDDEIVFVSEGYHAIHERRILEEEDPVVDEETAYLMDNGLAGTPYVTIANEVALESIKDGAGETIPFAGRYDNPFLNLTIDDLTKGEDGTYALPADFGLLFAHRAYGENLAGTATLTLGEDGSFVTLKGSVAATEDFMSTGVYTTVNVTVDFEYTIVAASDQDLPTPQPLENANAELEAILAKAKDGFVFSNLMDGEVVQSTYFDGEHALYQMLVPGAPMEMMMDMYLTPNAEGTMDLYWYMTLDEETFEWLPNDPATFEMYYEKVTYAELIGGFADLSASVFVKAEGQENVYVPEDAALKHIGEIIPGIYDALNLTSYDDFRLSSTAMTLTVVDDTTIDIHIESTYGTEAVSTVTADFRFHSIGDGTLPYTPAIETGTEA